MTTLRRTQFAAALVLLLGVTACNGDDEPALDPVETPAPEDDDAQPTADPAPDEAPTDGEQPGDDTSPDAGDDEATGDEAMDDEGPDPVSGEATTGRSTQEPTTGTLAVTNVRVASHDGFDRVVFDLSGDGQAGWNIEYDDAPASQGSGQPVDVEGEAYLAVSVVGVTLPPELPSDLEAYTEDTEGPADGAVTEIVYDSIFEGYHLFFIGLDEQRPYVVERLSDPQRLVIDLLEEYQHEGEPAASGVDLELG